MQRESPASHANLDAAGTQATCRCRANPLAFLGLSVVSGPVLGVALLLLGVSCLGIGNSNIWAITQTPAGPQAAGRWTGFQNFIGNLSGVVVASLTGLVLQLTGHFYWAFAILTAVALAGTTSWAFLVGRVEQVVWRKKLPATTVPA